eukprot:scaffold363795_cov28-Prasinocladus_malaysianus.AAC.1
MQCMALHSIRFHFMPFHFISIYDNNITPYIISLRVLLVGGCCVCRACHHPTCNGISTPDFAFASSTKDLISEMRHSWPPAWTKKRRMIHFGEALRPQPRKHQQIHPHTTKSGRPA